MRYARKSIASTRLPWASCIAALRNDSGLLILILAFSLGATRGNVQAPATRPASADKAWIDANPLVLYPISGNGLPPTAVALVADLRTGMERLLEPVKPGMPDRQLASPRGGTYPSLNSLRIDLTESVQQPNAPKIKIKKEIPARPGLSVDDFEFMAQPMHYCNGKLIYDLSPPRRPHRCPHRQGRAHPPGPPGRQHRLLPIRLDHRRSSNHAGRADRRRPEKDRNDR